MRTAKARNVCRIVPSQSLNRTVVEFIDFYIRERRPIARAERAFYAEERSWTTSAMRSLFHREDGKRHDHQRRLSPDVISRAGRALARLSPQNPSNFDEVHRFVERAILPIAGVGPLTVYDISCRIAARWGLRPNLVYLHAGTRKGAKLFGLTGDTISPGELPKDFRRLQADEIEDCLCGLSKL